MMSPLVALSATLNLILLLLYLKGHKARKVGKARKARKDLQVLVRSCKLMQRLPSFLLILNTRKLKLQRLTFQSSDLIAHLNFYLNFCYRLGLQVCALKFRLLGL